MKSIVLENISIRNFKGFKEYDLKVDGNSLDIKGANSTGKSSVYDAFMYCLFGKDSHNSAKFKWKPLDENNEEVHHLETEVELVFIVDGKKETLSRTTKEKWPKGVFDGNESVYKINDIKTTLNKYNKYIEELIDSETFKQLTNIYYVAEVMDVKQRRDFLFDLVGNMTDEDVIASDPELKGLTEVLDGRAVDEKKQWLKQEQTKVNQQIRDTETRMDENQRELLDLSDLDKEALTKEKDLLASKANYIHEEISIIRNGEQKTTLLAEKQTVHAEIETLRSNHAVKSNDELSELQVTKNELFEKAMDKQNEYNEQTELIRSIKQYIDTNKYNINKNSIKMAELREEFQQISYTVFEQLKPFKPLEDFDAHQATCQFCGQEYPEDKKEEILVKYEQEKEKHEADYQTYKKDYDERLIQFNLNRAKNLEAIREQGKQLGEENAESENVIVEENRKLDKETETLIAIEIKRDEFKEKHEEVKAKIKAAKENISPFESTEEYIAKVKQIEEIDAKMKRIDLESEALVNEKKDEMIQVNLDMNAIRDSIDQFRIKENQEKRIAELNGLHRKYSGVSGDIKQQLALIDLFIRTKVALLTDKINSQFGLVTFKLFDKTQDGNLLEVCEPIYKGAPFTGALNSGHKVLAGIDIINTVSKLKGVKVPLFVDNAESVTEKIDFDLQLLLLRATEGVKKLEVSVL